MGCGVSAEPSFVFRFRLLGGMNINSTCVDVQVPGTYGDAYAVVQCSGSQQTFTSKACPHERNPVWNQEFYFKTNTTAPELSIQVRCKDTSSCDEAIGTAKVNLHGLIGKTREREIWASLEGAKANGEIGFAVIECFRCHVTITQGLDVQPTTLLSGSSDMYVTLQVGQQAPQKTRPKSSTLNPIWNETFTVLVPYGIKSHLVMILYERDTVGVDHSVGLLYEDLDGKPRKEFRSRKVNCPIGNTEGRLELDLWDDTSLYGVTDAGPLPVVV